jgi:glycosyltransferase involved in cell wall biosynthesis
MKITLITACLNSQNTIQMTFNSVLNQNYKNIEHIIIDGESSDATQTLISDYPYKNKKVFIRKNLGLYGSLNFGIKKATGEYILMLHSDDVLNNENVISDIVKILKKKKYSCLFGSVVYFNKELTDVTRFYPGVDFSLPNLAKGLMPPHTGSVIKKDIYNKYLFNSSFKIAGDYDFFFRSLYLDKVDFAFTKKLIIRMRVGGISGKNIKSYIISTYEIYKSLVINNFEKKQLFIIIVRFIFKLKQIFFIDKYNLNLKLSQKVHKFYKDKVKNDFIIYSNINKFIKKKKFILSAMNLAFLGSFLQNNKIKFPHLYHWPDGLFAKLLNIKINKIPGRIILNKLKLYNNIKRIIVLGNLDIIAKNKLVYNFKKRVINYKLAYGNINEIFYSLKYIPKKSDLIFITLPTPKQEELAIKIAKKNKYFKIICIGGSIAIWSGLEKEVPKKYINFEFIWRLRYETLRRINRLILTFAYVFVDFLTFRKISKLNIVIKY